MCLKMAIRKMLNSVTALCCVAIWLAAEGQSITIGGENGVSIVDPPQVIVKQNARYSLWEGVDVAIKSVIDSGISPSLETVLAEIDEMARRNDIKLPYSYSLSGNVSFSTKGNGKTRMGRNTIHRTLTPQNKQRKEAFENRVAARILNVLRETPPYAGRIISRLESEVSQMLAETLLKDLNKDLNSGSFVLENLSLTHSEGNRYHGNVKIVFTYKRTRYLLKSRIEVVDDTSEKSYELNKKDWEYCLWETNVLPTLLEDTFKFLKYMGEKEKILDKDMSVKEIKQLTLIPNGHNRYRVYAEIEVQIERDVFTRKMHADVKRVGERIEWEFEPEGVK